ncbi:MAG: sugar ABC transporter permease [Spirochaetales bacterium]|nr:sugar ABC transporter permease [Spirochaetales bacterium]
MPTDTAIERASMGSAARAKCGTSYWSALRRRELLAALVFIAPNFIGFVVFVAGPTVASLVISLYDWSMVGEARFAGLANYRRLLFEDDLFPTVLLNTAYYVGAYVFVNVVFAMAMALWLTKRERFSGLYRVVFFMPVVFPVVAVAMIWKLLYLPEYGLMNAPLELLGLESIRWLADPRFAMLAIVIMSVWLGFGYNMVLFIAALKGVPEDHLDAARLDGAGGWRAFWHVKLPAISPAVFFATVMTVITSFQVFDQTYILTGGSPVNATNTIVLYMFQQGFEYFRMGYASAVAWVLFAVIFAATLLQSRMQKRWVHYE